VPGGGQERFQRGGVVGVVEHEHPARRPVELGPQRRVGVLAPLERDDPQGGPEVGQAGGGSGGVLGGDPPGDAAGPAPAVGELEGQLGLPDARQPDQRHRSGAAAVIVQGGPDPGEHVLAPHERLVPRRQVHRQRREPRRDGGREGFLGEHRGVHATQRGRRVDAELFGECAAAALERRQRVGLTSGGVQRADQAGGHRLPQRVPRGQLLQERDVLGGAAAAQVRVGQRFRGEHPQLLELGGGGGEEVRLAHRAERVRSAPPRQGPFEDHRRRVVVAAGERRSTPVDVVDEQVGVDRHDPPLEQVAAGPRRDGVAAEQPPQPRHVGVHRGRRRLRGVLAPDVVDDLLGRDRLAGPGQHAREHRLLPRPAERHGATVDRDCEVTQHAHRRVRVAARAVRHRCPRSACVGTKACRRSGAASTPLRRIALLPCAARPAGHARRPERGSRPLRQRDPIGECATVRGDDLQVIGHHTVQAQ
jgi:hypothetical protein